MLFVLPSGRRSGDALESSSLLPPSGARPPPGRVELEAAGNEVMRLVEMLDGLNRYRFDREPQLLAAWETAKHVVAGPQVNAPAGTPVTPTPPVQEQPVPGEVKPAA